MPSLKSTCMKFNKILARWRFKLRQKQNLIIFSGSDLNQKEAMIEFVFLVCVLSVTADKQSCPLDDTGYVDLSNQGLEYITSSTFDTVSVVSLQHN